MIRILNNGNRERKGRERERGREGETERERLRYRERERQRERTVPLSPFPLFCRGGSSVSGREKEDMYTTASHIGSVCVIEVFHFLL